MSTMLTSVQAALHGGMMTVLVQGGPVMVPLLASSVLSLTVLIERCCFWRRLRTRAQDTRILQCVRAGNVEEAQKRAHASQHPIARVLLAGLEYRQCSPGTAMA